MFEKFLKYTVGAGSLLNSGKKTSPASKNGIIDGLKPLFKRHAAAALSLFAMLAMAVNSDEIMGAAYTAMTVCAKRLIPSLFPFIAAAGIFINSVDKSAFGAACAPLRLLFGISPCGAAALIPGIICGYPVGADCACRLYENKMISKSEAESLIAFANNSGPLFIIGAVGSGILGSAKAGAALYAIHIFAAFICGMILKPFTRSDFGAAHENQKRRKKKKRRMR